MGIGGTQRGLTQTGISGALINIAGQTAKFHGRPLIYSLGSKEQLEQLFLQGGTDFGTPHYLTSSGGASITLEPGDDWPAPTVLRCKGSIAYQFDTGRTATVACVVTGYEVAENGPKGDDKPRLVITVAHTGAIAFVGWPSSQPTSTALTVVEGIAWNGTQFAVDASSLQSDGAITFAWWDTNVVDTNAGLISKLASVIGSLSIPSPYKAKVPSITRRSTDSGIATIPLALTSTAEDWLFARTRSNTDPSNLKNLTVLGAIYTRGSEPSPPGSSGLVLHHKEYFDITSSDCTNKAGVLWYYGETTTADDEIFPRSKTETDPQDIKSSQITGAIYTTGSPPSDPGVPSGLKLVSKEDYPLTDAGASNQSIRLYVYGKLDSKDEIEKLQSKTTAEPGNVKKQEIVVKVLDTATPVTDNTYNPDTTNLEFYTDEIHAITAAGTVHYVHVSTFKPLSPLNEDQEDFNQIADDPVSNLFGDDHRRLEDASATTAAPAVTQVGTGATMYCVRRITKKIGHTKYRHDFWYELRSVAAKLVADKTIITVDASALESEAFTAEVFLISGGPAGVGSAPFTNAQNINYRDFTVENPLYTLRVYGWALLTNQEKLEYGKSRGAGDAFGDDPSILASVNATTLPGQDYADSIREANTDPLAIDIHADRLTHAKALLTIETARDDKQLIISGVASIDDEVAGIPDPGGSGFGDPDAKQLCSYTDGGVQGIIQPILLRRTRATVKYRRYLIVDDEDDLQANRYPEWENTVNDDTLLGFPADSLKYAGADVKVSLSIAQASAKRLAVLDYVWEYDSALHFSPVNLFTGRVVFNTTVTTAGYFVPSTFIDGGSFCVIVWPNESDMTGAL